MGGTSDVPELKRHAHFFFKLLLFTTLSRHRFSKMKRVLHFGTSSAPNCRTLGKSETGLLLFATLSLVFIRKMSPVAWNSAHSPFRSGLKRKKKRADEESPPRR